MATIPDNPISFLQEISVKYKLNHMPKYVEVGWEGPPHTRQFSVRCEYGPYEVVGDGTSKKMAKKEAATKMVTKLHTEGYFEQENLRVDLTTSTVATVEGGCDQPETGGDLCKRPVSLLQEYCQKNSIGLPKYEEVSAPKGRFHVVCSLIEQSATGVGTSKRDAKSEAALGMCRLLRLVADEGPADAAGSNTETDEGALPEYLDIIKSPISLLKEHCEQNKLLIQPMYTEMRTAANVRIVVCSMGSKKTQGEGSSMKIAKTAAAQKMLSELSIAKDPLFPAPLPVMSIERVSPSSPPLEEFLNPEDKEDSETEPNIVVSMQGLGLDEKDTLAPTTDAKTGEEAAGSPLSMSCGPDRQHGVYL